MSNPQREAHPAFLPEWHRIVAERDVDGLGRILADDVSLGVPPYWGRMQGRDIAQHLLGLIIHTIEGFTYHREWQDERELALEFTGRVGERDLQGIDLITLEENGRVQNLDVLMRPVNGIIALREIVAPQMAAYLAEKDQGR